MFDWLFDNVVLIGLLLALAFAIVGTAWWKTGRRPFVLAAGGVCLLAIVYFGLVFTVETNKKQVERKIREMAEGVTRKDWNLAFSHFSDSFRLGATDKASFRHQAEQAANAHGVRGMLVKDINVVEADPAKRTALASFIVKVFGNWPNSEEAFYRCEAHFTLDPDGQWRLQTFQLFNPVVEGDKPMQLPF